MNVNVDFLSQLIADTSPLMHTSAEANGQFISPNPNLLTTHNNDSGVGFNPASEFPDIDILDFIPAAMSQQQQQQQQQQRQFQQYLRTPKSASSPQFQLSATNFSNQTTPAFGSVATFSSNSFLPGGSESDLLPANAQFTPITPGIYMPPQPVQQHNQFEPSLSTPNSVNGVSNSPVQFSPPTQQYHSSSSSSSSAPASTVGEKTGPTIGLGVSIEPTVNHKKQPSPHEQAALHFQQQLNNEAAAKTHNRSGSSSTKARTQSSPEMQKLIEQQREKQQQQLLLLQKGEIPKPPELKPKRKSSCRPHKQKKRYIQEEEQYQQQQQQQQQRRISSLPLQTISGDSPTTIEVSSPQSEVHNDNSFGCNTTTFISGGDITAEELLSNDPFQMLEDHSTDVFPDFADLDFEDVGTDFEKSIENVDVLSLNKNSSSTNVSVQRPTLKKKKSITPGPAKIVKTLKKASSFSSAGAGAGTVNGSLSPTFIINPKFQWTKSQTTEQQQRLLKKKVPHQHAHSLPDLSIQEMPVFTLSNHYSFVYENENTEENSQASPRKQQQQQQLEEQSKKESGLLQNLESGLVEFKLDLNKNKMN
ncbi:conserved hypothetical protein [Candida dubliniensis CD36]|uniref:Uncharacterized protein n=1 Tax=Candida dubliniensis (strain CD36 / ATCC MYA-646 / CBS 7987 / NCPF 3949 / NRRL Y-17841) TaxID=573826 RepID=B9WCP8_CANDC|nr:conserved hypothetical protein [Candida dubliniensis CD36]CAX44171.1 conserved hypothetical protein [Candida dubliniensis CD36]